MSKSRTPARRVQPESKVTRDVRPEIEKIAGELAHSLLGQCEPHEVAYALAAFKQTVQKDIAKLAENGTYLSDAAKAAEEALG